VVLDADVDGLVEGTDLLDGVEGETVREGGGVETDGGTEEGVVDYGRRVQSVSAC